MKTSKVIVWAVVVGVVLQPALTACGGDAPGGGFDLVTAKDVLAFQPIPDASAADVVGAPDRASGTDRPVEMPDRSSASDLAPADISRGPETDVQEAADHVLMSLDVSGGIDAAPDVACKKCTEVANLLIMGGGMLPDLSAIAAFCPESQAKLIAVAGCVLGMCASECTQGMAVSFACVGCVALNCSSEVAACAGD